MNCIGNTTGECVVGKCRSGEGPEGYRVWARVDSVEGLSSHASIKHTCINENKVKLILNPPHLVFFGSAAVLLNLCGAISGHSKPKYLQEIEAATGSVDGAHFEQ